MQEERRYTLGKYVFSTENEYNDAKKDLQMIRKLKEKCNVEDRDVALKVIKAYEFKKLLFHSKIGEDFVKYLRKNIKEEEDILGKISGESNEERTRSEVRKEQEINENPMSLQKFWKKKCITKEKRITNDKYSIKYIEENMYLVVEFLLFALVFSVWAMASMSYDYGSDPIECFPYGVIWLLSIRALPMTAFITLIAYTRGIIKNHHCWNRNVYCSQYINMWIYMLGVISYNNTFSDFYSWKDSWKAITNTKYLKAGRYYNLIYNGMWDPEFEILDATLLLGMVLLLPLGQVILGIMRWLYKCIQKRISALADVIPVFMVNPLKRKKLFILLHMGVYFVLFVCLYMRATLMQTSDIVEKSSNYYTDPKTESYQMYEKKNGPQEAVRTIGWEIDFNRIAKSIDGTIFFEDIQKENAEAIKETMNYGDYYQTELITSVNNVLGIMTYACSNEGEMLGLSWQGTDLSEQDYLKVLSYVSMVAELDNTASAETVNSTVFVWNNEIDIILQNCTQEAGIVRLYFNKHIRRNESEQNTILREMNIFINQKEFDIETLIKMIDYGLTIETIHKILGESDYQEVYYEDCYTLYYYDCILNGQKGTLHFSYGEIPGLYWNSVDGFNGYQELVDASRQFGEVEDQTTYHISYKYKDRCIRIRQYTNGYSFEIEPYIDWDSMW